MEKFENNKVFFVSLLLVIILEEPFVQAFSSTKCNHIEIEAHLKSTLNCMMKSQNKKIAEFSELQKTIIATIKDQHINESGISTKNETTELCELFEEEITCFTDLLGECLNKEVKNNLAEVMEYYLGKQRYISCRLMKGLDKEEVVKKIMYISNYTQDAESLNKMFIFDKMCSNKDLVISFKSKWPCIMVHVSAILQEFMPHAMPHILGEEICPSCPKPSQPKSIQICKTVVGMLNTCFGGTECISQREMDLIRDFLTTYYNVIMGFTVQITATFGSMSEVLHPVSFENYDIKESANITKKEKLIIKFTDMMVKDYKDNECQSSLKQFPVLIDDELMPSISYDSGNSFSVIITSLVLTILAVIVIAISGWVYYAYRNPGSQSGQLFIKSTARNRIFSTLSTNSVV